MRSPQLRGFAGRDIGSQSMSENLATGRKGGSRGRQGSAATGGAASAWFVREILPLEPLLMHYLRRNWKNASDIADLRQEVYVRIYDAASEAIPDNPKRFLLMTARNLLIDRVRHDQVVQIEAVADIELLEVAEIAAGPEHAAAARDELRQLHLALDRLPPRTREAMTLAYIEDLPAREIAARMGVTKSMVSKHLAKGMQELADALDVAPGIWGEK